MLVGATRDLPETTAGLSDIFFNAVHFLVLFFTRTL